MIFESEKFPQIPLSLSTSISELYHQGEINFWFMCDEILRFLQTQGDQVIELAKLDKQYVENYILLIFTGLGIEIDERSRILAKHIAKVVNFKLLGKVFPKKLVMPLASIAIILGIVSTDINQALAVTPTPITDETDDGSETPIEETSTQIGHQITLPQKVNRIGTVPVGDTLQPTESLEDQPAPEVSAAGGTEISNPKKVSNLGSVDTLENMENFSRMAYSITFGTEEVVHETSEGKFKMGSIWKDLIFIKFLEGGGGVLPTEIAEDVAGMLSYTKDNQGDMMEKIGRDEMFDFLNEILVEDLTNIIHIDGSLQLSLDEIVQIEKFLGEEFDKKGISLEGRETELGRSQITYVNDLCKQKGLTLVHYKTFAMDLNNGAILTVKDNKTGRLVHIVVVDPYNTDLHDFFAELIKQIPSRLNQPQKTPPGLGRQRILSSLVERSNELRRSISKSKFIKWFKKWRRSKSL